MTKNIKFVITRFVFFKLKMHQNPFSTAPDPAGGAYDAPPDPIVGWGGGYPSPLDASTVLRSPSTQNPGYAIATWENKYSYSAT